VTTSLARRIRDDLEAAIRSGEFLPGDRLPTEIELKERYGCARMTVSKAMAALAEQGLIERRTKAGSFVALPHVQTAVLEIPDITAVIASRGQDYSFDVHMQLTRQAAHADVDLGFQPNDDLLQIEGVHNANGLPFALERRLISLSTAPGAAQADFRVEAPGSWLLRHIPWTEARHRISARQPDTAAAKALGLPRTAACLQIERWTWRQRDPVTFVRQIYPGDSYDLVAEFTPR
jgi:GntR family histidine utilization transcriptional repressor